VPLVTLAKLALPALQAKPVNQAKMVLQELVALPVMEVPQAVLANKEALVLPASPAKMVPLAAANTAHRLVWLQVIKRRRSTSQAMFQIRHQLGRLFNNDQNHQFVQYFGLFTARFSHFNSLLIL
jgi:hypothetical protein